MKWFKREKNVGDMEAKMTEIEVLEKKEQEITKKEIEISQETLRLFTDAGRICHFGSGSFQGTGPITIYEKSEIKKLLDNLDKAQKCLLNLNMYTDELIKLSETIEKDLLDIRGVSHDKRNKYLSDSELRILNFVKNIKENIEQLITQLKKLTNQEWIKIINMGYFDPKDPQLSKTINNEMVAIHRGLIGLHTTLSNLFRLEREVEKLTTDYINA